MNDNIQKNVNAWLNTNIDDNTREQILELKKNEKELAECFYKDLEFGTGGMRGLMGVGTNRMNIYTIGMATQGLANYLLKKFPNQEIKTAIAYDSRNNSPLFAKTAAQVLSANGMIVYLYDSLRSTPQLSFTIRHLKCQSGIVITASHNPKEYNGYKVYWDDGAQIVAPDDKNIIAEVQKVISLDDVKKDEKYKNIKNIDSSVDDAYVQTIAELSINPEVIKKQKDMKIVYSPIHGSGITHVPNALEKIGFNNIHVVEEQKKPDGNFPTVIYPNPEEAEALKLSLNKAKEINADLVLATDPDADRVGIALKSHKNEWQLLNGNQTASLLFYYVLMQSEKQGKLKGNEFLCKTIVTSDIIEEIAKKFGVKLYDTLTGFKFIGEKIRQLEGKEKFLCGGEESYGYLIGDKVRDKDAIASCCMIAEMVAYAKENLNGAFNMLIDMYSKFNCYRESLTSLTKHGKSGQDEIKAIMDKYRTNPPKTISNTAIEKILDYSNSTTTNMKNGEKEKLNFPATNVLQFILEDGTKISARPSGTEPKIKFYFSVSQPLDNKENYDTVWKKLGDKIDDLKQEFL